VKDPAGDALIVKAASRGKTIKNLMVEAAVF
jgi:hypothetical protein